MSIAVMISCVIFANRPASKVSSSRRNLSRLMLARLQEELSRLMYSEQGLLALIRPDSGLVCQSLMVPSYLIVPAEASAPRMKETGPLAVPPEDSSSLLDLILDRLTPAPEPPLKIRPSSRYHSRMASMVSSTARMKHALTCCFDVVPTLNQTGELKLKIWWTRA